MNSLARDPILDFECHLAGDVRQVGEGRGGLRHSARNVSTGCLSNMENPFCVLVGNLRLVGLREGC